MQRTFVGLRGGMRVPGYAIFSLGALALVDFVAGLWLFPKREDEVQVAAEKDSRAGARAGD